MAAVQALEMIAGARDTVRQRVALAGEAAPDDAGGPSLRRLAGELSIFAQPFRRLFTKTLPVPRAAHPTTVIDTIGAGDTFGAALLDGLWRQQLLESARTGRLQVDDATRVAILTRAARAAAICVARRGANPPTLAELDG